MELDELKIGWKQLEKRLEAQKVITQQLITDQKLERTQSRLRRFLLLPICELVSGIVAALLVGSFLFEGPHELRFVLSGVVLHIAAVLTIVASMWQIAKIGQIDYSKPVLDIQEDLAGIRAFRIGMNQWIFALALLLWMPLCIVLFQGLFTFDIVAKFSPAWVWTNIGLGIIAVPVLYWAMKRYGSQLSHTAFGRRLVDDLAGQSLSRALRDLESVKQFQVDAQP